VQNFKFRVILLSNIWVLVKHEIQLDYVCVCTTIVYC